MCFRRKKEVQPAPEKKPSIVEMKVKMAAFRSKIDKYIAKLQEGSNKYVEKAAAAKLRGADASQYVKRVAFLAQKIKKADNLRGFLEMRLEDYEMLMLDQEFLTTFSGVSEMFGSFEMNSENMQNMTESIEKANIRIAEQQEKMQALMDGIDSAMSVNIDSGDAALDEVAKRIDDIITQEVNDSQLDTNVTAASVAKKAASKINA